MRLGRNLSMVACSIKKLMKKIICLWLLALSLVLPADAALITWTGNVSGNWSSTGNWAGGMLPLGSGDSLNFATSSNKILNQDLGVGKNISSLKFQEPNYVLNGSRLDLTGAASISVTASATLATINLPVTSSSASNPLVLNLFGNSKTHSSLFTLHRRRVYMVGNLYWRNWK